MMTAKERREVKKADTQVALALIKANPGIKPWELALSLKAAPVTMRISATRAVAASQWKRTVYVEGLVESHGWIWTSYWYELPADDHRRKFNADGTPVRQQESRLAPRKTA